jgi:hypothetical protein
MTLMKMCDFSISSKIFWGPIKQGGSDIIIKGTRTNILTISNSATVLEESIPPSLN